MPRTVGSSCGACRERRPFLLFAHFHDPHPGFLVHPETGFAQDLPAGLKGGETLEFLGYPLSGA